MDLMEFNHISDTTPIIFMVAKYLNIPVHIIVKRPIIVLNDTFRLSLITVDLASNTKGQYSIK